MQFYKIHNYMYVYMCMWTCIKIISYPVLFLTEAGDYKRFDPRCDSLREAVQFACRANLLGIFILFVLLIDWLIAWLIDLFILTKYNK